MISAVGTVSVHTWIFLSSSSLSCEGKQQSLQLIRLPPELPLVCLTAGPGAHLDLWWEVQTSPEGCHHHSSWRFEDNEMLISVAFCPVWVTAWTSGFCFCPCFLYFKTFSFLECLPVDFRLWTPQIQRQ